MRECSCAGWGEGGEGGEGEQPMDSSLPSCQGELVQEREQKPEEAMQMGCQSQASLCVRPSPPFPRLFMSPL